MRATPVLAWILACLGTLMLAAAPAEAAGNGRDRGRQTVSTGQAARQAPAPRPAGRRAAATHRTASTHRTAAAAPRMRTESPAPLRGRLAVSRDRQAAVSQGSCRRVRGQRQCGPAMSWTSGLEPAAGIQAQECPDGTMATPARGHENIIRCMPI